MHCKDAHVPNLLVQTTASARDMMVPWQMFFLFFLSPNGKQPHKIDVPLVLRRCKSRYAVPLTQTHTVLGMLRSWNLLSIATVFTYTKRPTHQEWPIKTLRKTCKYGERGWRSSSHPRCGHHSQLISSLPTQNAHAGRKPSLLYLNHIYI